MTARLVDDCCNSIAGDAKDVESGAGCPESHVSATCVRAGQAAGRRKLRGNISRGHDHDIYAAAPVTGSGHNTQMPRWPLFTRAKTSTRAIIVLWTVVRASGWVEGI